MPKTQKPKVVRESIRYFIDESGDTALFDSAGRTIAGQNNSRFFMLGVGFVDGDPEMLDAGLSSLRERLLADAAFSSIPSMDPARGKTARFFHAKDDHPKIRPLVFQELGKHACKLLVAIRRKDAVAEDARRMFRYRGLKLSAHSIYDDLLFRAVRDRLHAAKETVISVARRGTRERRSALMEAVERGKRNFQARYGATEFGSVTLDPCHPSSHGGLQMVDYYLWALQRMLEHGDPSYYEKALPVYRLIIDLDDKRKAGYGAYYSASNPLTLEKISPP